VLAGERGVGWRLGKAEKTNSSPANDAELTNIPRDNSGVHGFVRSPEGIITSFDVPNEPFLSPFGANPTSINEEGVITGWCFQGGIGTFSFGWVRHP
jgi:hypothetical protein